MTFPVEPNITIGEAVAARRPEEFYVKEHGLAGDWVGTSAAGSGTNDTAALLALIELAPAGSRIIFDKFSRYRLDPMLLTKSLIIDFNGATIVTQTQTSTTEAPFIRFDGGFGNNYAINAAVKGALSVTLSNPAHASNFARGQVVQLRDQTPLMKWNSGSYTTGQHEMARVRSVSGAVVSFDAPSTDRLQPRRKSCAKCRSSTPRFATRE